MNGSRIARSGAACCAVFCACVGARADDLTASDAIPPSAWIVNLGGYAVFEPTWLGSKSYTMSFRPIGEFRQAGDKEWVLFPNDALTYSFVQTENFRAGPGGSLSLQSWLHGEDIDLRLVRPTWTCKAASSPNIIRSNICGCGPNSCKA